MTKICVEGSACDKNGQAEETSVLYDLMANTCSLLVATRLSRLYEAVYKRQKRQKKEIKRRRRRRKKGRMGRTEMSRVLQVLW